LLQTIGEVPVGDSLAVAEGQGFEAIELVVGVDGSLAVGVDEEGSVALWI
jgi:hypothetical protein